MNPVVINKKAFAVTYDASLADVPGVEFFTPEYWQSRNALSGEALGRGSTWFVDAPFGRGVLRRYLRGGWVARISRQSYFFTTVSRSRPFREFAILSRLYEQGLPVPRPVAALCEHKGLVASGSIMTMRIEAAQTLADLLPAGDGPMLAGDDWQRVGGCIRRFHRAGAWHADLNARNILLDGDMQVYVIDFDRGRLTRGAEVNGKRNLERLKRSLEKLWPAESFDLLPAAWEELLKGYHA